MRGMAGDFRLDGGVPEVIGSDLAGNQRVWRSPDARLTLTTWGHPHSACEIGWHVDDAAGLVLVADCTLYDREQLAAALGLAPWAGSSAELLLQAWLRWGGAMLERLDGDFAFVICDLHARKLVAAVDPMGMRPLFYRHEPGRRFTFATSQEVLAVQVGLDPRIPEHRLLEPLFNAERLAHFEPEVAGITRLWAARVCRVDAKCLHVARYWTPGAVNPGLADGDVAGWAEALRWQLDAAVRKRLADGVNTGLTFSGGLDSSAILALACGMVAPQRFTAYSVLDRGNPGCPETRAIDQMLAATGAVSVRIDVATMQAEAALARAVVARAPRFVSGRNGFLPLFDQMACESGVDVMMNGIDADAMFHYEGLVERMVLDGRHRDMLRDARKLDHLAGGAWMVPDLRRARLTARLPWPLRAGIRRVRGRLGESKLLHAALLRDDAAVRLDLRGRIRAHRRLVSSPAPPARTVPSAGLVNPYTLDGIGRFQQRSRHFGVEMRCPFLDRALIDFSAWIPLELRMRHGRLKWILRKAMSPYLPHNVVWRGDKFHLGSHFDRVMLQPVLEQAVRDFSGSGPAIAPYVDRTRFLQQAAHWQNGAIEAVWELKMLLLLELWLQHNADKVAWGC